MSRIVILAGKPPKPGTILAEVTALLEARDDRVDLALPKQEALAAATLAADLVLHRGLGPGSPAVAAVADAGLPLCNPWPAVGLDGDRPAVMRALAARGVPVPGGTSVESWAEVRAMAAGRRVVVKRVRGTGRGRDVTDSVSAEAPFDGPYVVEEWIPNDGLDRKLYVAGETVFGLLKPSTLTADHVEAGAPLEPDAALRSVALAAVAAAGLHLAGVDVVAGADGPVVVDVNPFPGYRGLPGAAEAIVGHLDAHLG